jgi:hypothetical protein
VALERNPVGEKLRPGFFECLFPENALLLLPLSSQILLLKSSRAVWSSAYKDQL